MRQIVQSRTEGNLYKEKGKPKEMRRSEVEEEGEGRKRIKGE